MTPQEILEQEGFIVWSSMFPLRKGEVVTEAYNDGLVPRGTKAVITEEITLAEAKKWAARTGNGPGPPAWAMHFYKAIAE